jgi:hypothetical protein
VPVSVSVPEVPVPVEPGEVSLGFVDDEPGRVPSRVEPGELPGVVLDGLAVPLVPDVPVALVSPDEPAVPVAPVAPVAPGPLVVPLLVVPVPVVGPPIVPPGVVPPVPPVVSLCSVGIGLGVWLLLRSRSLRHALPIVAATTNAERKIQRVI